MSETQHEAYYRDRAQREIALAMATGARAHASPDYKTVFIQRRDGSRESVRIPEPRHN
jgi:hypothetical protein